MIPLFAVIRIWNHQDTIRGKRRRHRAPRRLGLWLPFFLIWLLLLPLVLVLLPLAMLALLLLRVNPLRALAALWQTIAGLTGTHIEVRGPDALVYLHIF